MNNKKKWKWIFVKIVAWLAALWILFTALIPLLAIIDTL